MMALKKYKKRFYLPASIFDYYTSDFIVMQHFFADFWFLGVISAFYF